jgi:micrococcal nuclease
VRPISRIVSVLDRDILEVLHKYHPERIRLSGLEGPEKSHAYGNNATPATAALVVGKAVMLQSFGKDQCGRTLADVRLLEGTHVDHTVVKDGWCWWDRKYAPGDVVLEGLEREARKAKKGLWGAPVHVPSWEWRKRTR